MLPYLPHPEMKSAKCDLTGQCLHQFRYLESRQHTSTTRIVITEAGAKAMNDPQFRHKVLTTIRRWMAEGLIK